MDTTAPRPPETLLDMTVADLEAMLTRSRMSRDSIDQLMRQAVHDEMADLFKQQEERLTRILVREVAKLVEAVTQANRAVGREVQATDARTDDKPPIATLNPGQVRRQQTEAKMMEVAERATEPMTRSILLLKAVCSTSRTDREILEGLIKRGELVEVQYKKNRSRAWQVWTPANAKAASIQLVGPPIPTPTPTPVATSRVAVASAGKQHRRGRPTSHFITAFRASELSGMSVDTVRRWVHMGSLTNYGGRRMRIKRSELDVFLGTLRGTQKTPLNGHAR